MGIGLLLLRLTVGVTLAAHGAQKLYGWFGGYGPERTGQFMEAMGFLPGRRHAVLAGAAEVGGGLLLAIGFLTPLAAAVVASVMLVAAVTVHLKNGFFAMTNGYEYAFVLGLAGLSIAFTGPGPLSIDGLLGISVGGTEWGLAAVVVAVIGATGQLAQRHPAQAPLATTNKA